MDKDVEGDRIGKMIEVIMEVARGNYAVQIEPSGRNDDLDSLAMGLNMMIDDIRNSVEEVKALNERLRASNEELQDGIAERKRIEETLRESEARYRTLFEGAAEGILVADIETKAFLYANPAICTMLGYTE